MSRFYMKKCDILRLPEARRDETRSLDRDPAPTRRGTGKETEPKQEFLPVPQPEWRRRSSAGAPPSAIITVLTIAEWLWPTPHKQLLENFQGRCRRPW